MTFYLSYQNFLMLNLLVHTETSKLLKVNPMITHKTEI